MNIFLYLVLGLGTLSLILIITQLVKIMMDPPKHYEERHDPFEEKSNE